MPTTTNYGWITPVVTGDLGAWGGILNTAIAEIDADVFAGFATKANLAGGNTFTGAQVFSDGIRVVANGLRRPDNAGTAFLPGNGTNISYGTTEFRDASGANLRAVIADSGTVTMFGALAVAGGTVVGVDPGGAEIARVGGSARFSGYVRCADILNTTGAFLRPDNTGVALSLGNGLQRAFGEVQVRDASGASLWAVINGTGASFVGTVSAAGQFSGNGAGLTNIPWSAIVGAPTSVSAEAANVFTNRQTIQRAYDSGIYELLTISNTTTTEADGFTGVRFIPRNGVAALSLQASDRFGLRQFTMSAGLAISGDYDTDAVGARVRINGTPVLGARRTGWTAGSGTTERGAFNTDTASVQDVARRLLALEVDLRAHGLIN